MVGIIKDGVGKIEYREVKPEVQSQEPSRTTEEFETGRFQVQKVDSFKAKIGVTAMATSGTNTVWVACWDEDTMYLYDSGGKVLRSVTVMKGKGIIGVVVKRSGDAIVTSRDKKVMMVNSNGKVTTLINTEPFYAFGVCLTEAEEIVVCMRDGEDESNSHLAVYSSDGSSKVSEVRPMGTDNKNLFTFPWRVVQNGEDFCVVYLGGNVVRVDRTGRVRWVYDGRAANLGKKINPMEICSDKYQHVLVSDSYNSCVHCLDREGQLMQLILTEKQLGMTEPYGITVDRDTGLLWVGKGSGNVVIASYDV